jgi:hypothetical protein
VHTVRRILAAAVVFTSVATAGIARADDEKLLTEAQEAYIHGNFTEAIAKARRANTSGTNLRAWRVVGTSGCFLKDRATIDEAYGHLDAKGKELVRYVCGRNGVDLK